jgi:hypothetical protein
MRARASERPTAQRSTRFFEVVRRSVSALLMWLASSSAALAGGGDASATTVTTTPSGYPVKLGCSISTENSAAGTAGYNTDFSATYQSTTARRITMVLVKFTLSGTGQAVSRTFLDSVGIEPSGMSSATWRLSQIAPFRSATCTIAGVKYQ